MWSGIVIRDASGTMTAAGRRYLALFLPFLPADRLRAAGGGAPDGPFAFIEARRGAMRVAAVDPRALALGIAPGMALADARARLPELAAVDHDARADRLWLERIADGCDRYTPMVALDPPDGLTLDVSGCAHLFGGEAGLADDLERRFAPRIGHLRHAFAATPEGAQALARFQTLPAANEAQALRRLPVAALRLDGEAELALRRAGLKTIGDLASRPTAPLAARFGAESSAMLARLLGRADSRIAPRRPPPALLLERRLAEPIARTDHVLQVIGDLVDEAALALEAARKGGRRFAARLFRSDGRLCDLAVETGRPVRDAAVVMRLFAERVAALADPLDPGFGFDLVRLAVPVAEALAPAQLQLEGGGVTDDALAALVDRLSVRLGRGRVRRFAPQDSHIPEQGVLALPAVEAGKPGGWDAPAPGDPPLRPIHLFDPPQPIEVMAQVPDGPPHRFRWRRALHDVTRFEGPERIAAEWWQGRPQALTRDYYRVEDRRGRRFWIFRYGLYGSEAVHPGWYIHGLFA